MKNGDPPSNLVLDMPIEKVSPDSNQPRKHFNEQSIRDLADSIKQHGLLQPILVRHSGNGVYQIVHGERRYRAHLKANLPTIKCIVEEVPDNKIRTAQLVENLLRSDLTDIELAKEFQKQISNGKTHEEIGKAIGKSRAFVTQRLSLLRLSKEQQRKLETGHLDFTTARILASQKNDGEEQKENQCYAVTKENLIVPNLFNHTPTPSLTEIHQAYRKDLVHIRKALRSR